MRMSASASESAWYAVSLGVANSSQLIFPKVVRGFQLVH
jgi:hypothetical protein